MALSEGPGPPSRPSSYWTKVSCYYNSTHNWLKVASNYFIVIRQTRNFIVEQCMHFTVLIMHLEYYKLVSILKNKATNLLNQHFCSKLDPCKINYCLLRNKVEEQVSKTCLSVYWYHNKGVATSHIYPKYTCK